MKEKRIQIYEAQKTRVGRVVYLSDDALGALRAWFKERDSHKLYLFYAQGRHSMTYSAARCRFNKYIERAGLGHKGYSLHCLRHTFATELLNAGMRLESLQPLLGHSTVEMTRRYARLKDKTREQEYFRAMAIIEGSQRDEHDQRHRQLPSTPQEAQLLSPHREELHEHP